MLITIVSLLGLAVLAPWLHRLSGRYAGALLAAAPLAAFVYLATRVGRVVDDGAILESTPWAPQLGVALSFRLDGLSLLFGLLITGIGTLIVLYGGTYLEGHRDRGRFFAWLFCFMAAMLGVVLADDLILLFVFWELTSISSYFLIGFDHDREVARKLALQALLVTGSGGLCMLAGVILIAIATGASDFSGVLATGDALREHALYGPILVLLCLGAFTKSAQFPFHFWLPNAMEAPTPVSAYLHSSTMVKAGVYLLARVAPVMGGTDAWVLALSAVGGVTMVLGAFLAVQQSYLKKILAYSTVSALGVLVFLLGIGGAGVSADDPAAGRELAVYAGKAFGVFLLAHALYKAALFLVAGTITHATHEKDVGRLGGLAGAMPITAGAALLAALSMAGFPPFFGFIGKELLLEASLQQPALAALLTAMSVAAGALFVVVALLIAVRPFYGRRPETPHPPHEAPAAMWLPPAALGVAGLLLGLFPATLAQPLLGAVVASVTADPGTQVKLSLWHGFNLPLALSGAALLVGVFLYVAHARVLAALGPLRWVGRLGPERWYDAALNGALAAAAVQTRLLQSGYLRRYLQIIILTLVALAGVTLARAGGLPLQLTGDDILGSYLFKLVAAAMILLGTLGAVHFRSRLTAIASLGIVGYGVALVYVVYGAPDLAITQFLVETLTVILFVLVFYHVKDARRLSSTAGRVRDMVLAGAAGALMSTLVLVATSVQYGEPISGYFAEQSVPGGHGRNIVNVILVDFRALDTLGEITVLAVSAVGVFALLKLRRHYRKRGASS